ncbi:MAG: NAD-dependent epimerase/dehydratase family protein [Candidatus Humimicrobiaceae bacterium]
MRVVVIGGSGHVGTYLIPRLVEAGHEVIELSRGSRKPYLSNPAWEYVRRIKVDRETEEMAGSFGQFVSKLNPDVVIDMICFNIKSACHLVQALKNNIRHFLSCGTIWVYGYSIEVPATEDQAKCPFGEYGIQKLKIEEYLIEEARVNNFPATILRPGHIVGPGWIPVNPAGNLNPDIFSKLAREEEISLPNIGMETLHHVHAEDVAQIFMLAINNWKNSIGESFNAVSPKALTLRGYAEKVASWFGKTAKINYLPWDDWCKSVSEEESIMTWDHIAHSPNCSIEKARSLLGYQPHYTSLQALQESVHWLVECGIIKLQE